MNDMGTNYYLYDRSPCPTCGREYNRMHIGKCSLGWYFALHVMPEEGIHDLADWEALWARDGAYIEDEYGRRVSELQMRETITERDTGKTWGELRARPPMLYDSWAVFHRENDSEEGERGLLRRRDKPHGDGTYDLVEGEFS